MTMLLADGNQFLRGLGMGERLSFTWHKDEKMMEVRAQKGAPSYFIVETRPATFVHAKNEAGEEQETGDGGRLYLKIEPDSVWQLRIVELPLPKMTPKQMEKARRTKKRFGHEYHVYEMPENVLGLIASLQEKLAEVPEPFRDDATFEFDGEHRFQILYWSPETDDELIDRLKIEAQRQRMAAAAERAQLQRLQEKYGKEADE